MSSVTVCTFWKVKPKFFKFVVCNPCQSSPSFTMFVPLWFIVISLMFFYHSKLLFSGFLSFKGDFVCGQKNDKTPWLSSSKDLHYPWYLKILSNCTWLKGIFKYHLQYKSIIALAFIWLPTLILLRPINIFVLLRPIKVFIFPANWSSYM